MVTWKVSALGPDTRELIAKEVRAQLEPLQGRLANDYRWTEGVGDKGRVGGSGNQYANLVVRGLLNPKQGDTVSVEVNGQDYGHRLPIRDSLDGESASARRVGEVEAELSRLGGSTADTERLLVQLTSRLESVLRPPPAQSAPAAANPTEPVLVPRADSVRGIRKTVEAANVQLQALLDRLEL